MKSKHILALIDAARQQEYKAGRAAGYAQAQREAVQAKGDEPLKPKTVLALTNAANQRGFDAGYDAGLAKAIADFAQNVEMVASVGEDTQKQSDVWQTEAKRLATEHADCRDRLAVAQIEIKRLAADNLHLPNLIVTARQERDRAQQEVRELAVHLANAEGERDRMTRERDESKALHAHLSDKWQTVGEILGVIPGENTIVGLTMHMKAEIKRLAADCERLDWAEENRICTVGNVQLPIACSANLNVRQSIDKARKKEGDFCDTDDIAAALRAEDAERERLCALGRTVEDDPTSLLMVWPAGDGTWRAGYIGQTPYWGQTRQKALDAAGIGRASEEGTW